MAVNDRNLRFFLDNLSRIILAVLVLLLGLVYWLGEEDKSFTVEEPAKQTEATLDTKKDPAAAVVDKASLERVEKYLGEKPPIEQTDLMSLTQWDVFLVQAPSTRDDLQKQADIKFAAAQQEFDRGNMDLAEKMANEIQRKIYPPHEKSRALLEKIREKKRTKAAETPAAGPAPK